MLKVKMIPVLAGIISKIEIQSIIDRIKNIDITTDGQTSFKDLTDEQKAIIIFEIGASITPQLANIADDIPLLIAMYKNITILEAEELDFFAVIKEMINDSGLLSFFASALQKKVAQDV